MRKQIIIYSKYSITYIFFIVSEFASTTVQHILSSFMAVVISSNIVLNRAAPASLKHWIVQHVNCSSSCVCVKARRDITVI